MDLAGEFARGYVAGVLGLCVGFPFETLKVALQQKQSGSVLQELARVVKSRGALALFDGLASPVSSYGFLIASNFTIYASTARALESRFEPSGQFGTSACHGVAGLVSGGLLSVISTPFEMVKLRLQANASVVVDRPKHMATSLSCAKHIWKTERLRGFFKGSAFPANFIVLVRSPESVCFPVFKYVVLFFSVFRVGRLFLHIRCDEDAVAARVVFRRLVDGRVDGNRVLVVCVWIGHG